ncbi:MAG: hypothetical protein ACPK85_08035 [Methanosarcina sp.]
MKSFAKKVVFIGENKKEENRENRADKAYGLDGANKRDKQGKQDSRIRLIHTSLKAALYSVKENNIQKDKTKEESQ